MAKAKNQKVKPAKKSFLAWEVSFGTVSLTQKALFAKNLAVMLKAGLTITESLDICQESSSGRLKKIIKNVLKSVIAGSSLSQALSRYQRVFSGFFLGAIYAGESSGTLSENLDNVSLQLEKENDLNSKVKGALFYPAVVLSAAFLLGLGLAFFVLPKIIPLFEGMRVKLPLSTRVLIWFAHFVKQYGIYLFPAIIGFCLFAAWFLRCKFVRPFTHAILLKTPIFSKVVRNINLSRFARTVGMLLKSGVNIDQAINIAHETIGNYYYKRALKKVGQNIIKGKKLSTELMRFEKLFPSIFTRMVKVGEESGRFEETLFYLADFYEGKVSSATKTLASAIEPMLLLLVGLIVAFFALSIMSPIYNITGGLKH